MKLSTLLHVGTLSLFSSSSDAVECRAKTDSCQTNVQVEVIDLLFGLKDNIPVEVYESFITASSQCFNCVDETDVEMLNTGAGDNVMSYFVCKRSCCQHCDKWFCQDHFNGGNYCPDQCYGHFPECAPSSRRLFTGEDEGGEEDPYFVNYDLNVCMDDITPLDTSSTSYVDYTQLLADLETELHACYEDKETFLNSWSSLCAEDGIDLSLMARQEGDLNTIMFGQTGLDSENAVVTTYSSDESHRSTSHMFFYAALGFVAVSAFAVVGTAVVVKVLNKRKEAEEAQAAQWVAEMTATENTNPLSSTSATCSES